MVDSTLPVAFEGFPSPHSPAIRREEADDDWELLNNPADHSHISNNYFD